MSEEGRVGTTCSRYLARPGSITVFPGRGCEGLPGEATWAGEGQDVSVCLGLSLFCGLWRLQDSDVQVTHLSVSSSVPGFAFRGFSVSKPLGDFRACREVKAGPSILPAPSVGLPGCVWEPSMLTVEQR